MNSKERKKGTQRLVVTKKCGRSPFKDSNYNVIRYSFYKLKKRFSYLVGCLASKGTQRAGDAVVPLRVLRAAK